MRAALRAAGFAALAALLPAAVLAGVGVKKLAPRGDDGPVTVFYPSAAPEAAVQRGPFRLSLAEGAAPARGNGRLVVISHGSGGNAWAHSELARALVKEGFVVAVPLHHRDNALDPSRPGPDSWKRRPAEVSRAIDAVATDATLGPLALDRVGVYGMSAGGHTALTLAGGRWSPAQFRRHCEAHLAEDFHACVGLFTELKGDAFDGVRKFTALAAIRTLFRDDTWQVHSDPRVKAVVAAVPLAADFDAASLAAPRVPLGLVTAARDAWLAPRFHGDAILAACLPRCEQVGALAQGGHGALLSPLPPAEVLPPIAARLLADPPGFQRAELPALDARIAAFFRRHLLP
jgi:predicted dienelactone hydrolase